MQKILGMLDAMAGWLAQYREFSRQAQLRREIAHLDERLLRDIGLWDGRR
jgi:uncharacterized protein YjiS (DUF1127 family)